MQAHINGTIESILFENPENGFVVFHFKPESAAPSFVAVGILQVASAGQPLKLTGAWETNKNFGRQFKFSSAVVLRPSTTYAIKQYLGSGMIPGIGKVTAERIVNHFGSKTLDVMDEDPDALTQVPGIGKKTCEKIKKSIKEKKAGRALALLCNELDLPMSLAPKLDKAYGANAEKIIKANPYRLALDIKGVGFATADQVARGLGIDKTHEGRALAGLVHTLEKAGEDGHVTLPEEVLLDKAARLLDLDEAGLHGPLMEAVQGGLLIRDQRIADEPMIYSPAAFLIETQLAERFKLLMKTPGTVRDIDKDKAIEWVENKLGITLADMQRQAVTEAVSEKVMVVTGGPGTGKTTIIRAILVILAALKKSVALAAPTGRAAKRMSEATGQEAMTIHRLLHFNPIKGGFDFDKETPLPVEAVIVDEASMLDQWLANKLFSAVSPVAKLILVGDVDQLPSVGPGNVLCDAIESGKVPYIRLDKIFRQDDAGLIVQNAHRINAGLLPILPKGKQVADFYFIPENDPEKLRDLVCDLAARRLPERFGFDPLEDIQVLTPMHRGATGVTSLNTMLQNCLNPNASLLNHRQRNFRVNDKVMQTVNNYDKEVFNGDIGRVHAIVDNKMDVRFDDRIRSYTYDELDHLTHAYAISVHKSQGSEYPAVIVPLSTQHYILLQRNLLYTAVTRAKKLVILTGSYQALHHALANNRPAMRYTGLAKRLMSNP